MCINYMKGVGVVNKNSIGYIICVAYITSIGYVICIVLDEGVIIGFMGD